MTHVRPERVDGRVHCIPVRHCIIAYTDVIELRFHAAATNRHLSQHPQIRRVLTLERLRRSGTNDVRLATQFVDEFLLTFTRAVAAL